MIVEKIKEKYKPVQYPIHSNRCSTLGHPCLKFLVHERLDWDQKAPIPYRTLMRMEIGKLLEKQTIIELLQAGFDIIHQQMPYFLRDYQISGKIDGKIIVNGKVYAIEIKSMESWNLRKFNRAEDLLNADKYYYQGYYHQLNLYLYMMHLQNEKVENGIFILRGFDGSWKEIPMTLNEEKVHEILEKAKQINYHVEKKTYPEPLWKTNPDRLEVCLTCSYKHICLTEAKGFEKIVFQDDDELLSLLKERAELEDYAKRYEELTDKIKEAFSIPKETQIELLNKKEDEKLFVIDRFIIKRKLYWQTEYQIPKEIKQQYAVKVPRCRITIDTIE
jgi:flagellar biosynthesis regulator FlbT